ncbi:hypothetical protein AOLI_G00038170 [Acnodon oligacanthus]
MEAICLQLYMSPRGQKIAGFRFNRWGVVLRDYGRIRRLVRGSPGLTQATAIQLFEINQRTLSMCHNNLQKKQELSVLSMQIPKPIPSMTAADPLAKPRQNIPEPDHPRSFVFVSPPDLSGQAVWQGQRPVPEHLQYLASAPQPAPLPHPAPALPPTPPLPLHPAPLPWQTVPPPPFRTVQLPHLQPANDPEGKNHSVEEKAS